MRNFVLVVFFIGCASGPQAHDTSVAGHEQAAREHETEAATLERECAGPSAGSGPCWKNRHKPIVAEHRELAAKHRAASVELVQAEAQACAGLADDDRAMSPFEHPDDIASVEPLIDRMHSAKSGQYGRQVGATVTLRAVPGLTAEYLQRLVDCHVARNASLGHVVPEMPDCPLVPRGVTAHVRSTGNAFAVDIRSDDSETAREVLARAQRSAGTKPVSAR